MMSAAGTSRRSVTALLVVVLVSLGGCASAPPAQPARSPFDNIRRVAVVVTGESRFTVVEHRAEPGQTFDELLARPPLRSLKSLLQPLAALVHQGINWLLDFDDSADAGRHVRGISPKAAVSIAFSESLAASERFQEIQMPESEPVGDDRRRLDAIVRITVPSWGLVSVRDGDPALLSGFADVRAELMARGTGVVIWEHREDVTDPERLPLASFKKDPEFTRHHLLDVLTRAGQRLANELLYAQGTRR